MAQRLIAPIAPRIQLFSGYTVLLCALDPTTGADVNGITVSHVAMQVDVEEPPPEPVVVAGVPPLFVYAGESA